MATIFNFTFSNVKFGFMKELTGTGISGTPIRKNYWTYNILLIGIVVGLRLVDVFIINSWFVPDETFQSTEVAHHSAYGYGYLTWEWKENIRSPLHPYLYGSYFSFLQNLGIDSRAAVVEGPRILSALAFTYCDLSVILLSRRIYGGEPLGFTLILLYNSWFLHYCAPRSLINCAETVIFMLALCLYPFKYPQYCKRPLYLIVIGFGCLVRPTIILLIIPFYLRHLWESPFKVRLVFETVKLVIMTVVLFTVSALARGMGFQWILNFVKFNLLSGQAAHYGTHQWYWYLGPGFMVIFPLHFIAVWGALSNWREHKVILVPCAFVIFMYSLIPHKESRFLLPLFPLVILVCGKTISDHFRNIKSPSGKLLSKILLWTYILANNGALYYLGRVHQVAPIETVKHLSNVISPNLHLFKDQHLLFLMPCHSTPLYSHLHVNVSVEVLTCEPNLRGEENYIDEADVFYQNPKKWIDLKYPDFSSNEKRPACIVLFDKLHDQLADLLHEAEYYLSAKFFNTHFPDDRRSSEIHLICRLNFKGLMMHPDLDENVLYIERSKTVWGYFLGLLERLGIS